MKICLKIWRQKKTASKGKFKKYILNNVTEDMSFLEMLDMLNNNYLFLVLSNCVLMTQISPI